MAMSDNLFEELRKIRDEVGVTKFSIELLANGRVKMRYIVDRPDDQDLESTDD